MLETAVGLIAGRRCPRCSGWTMQQLGLNARGEDLYSVSIGNALYPGWACQYPNWSTFTHLTGNHDCSSQGKLS